MAGHFESGILLLFRRRSPGFLCPASLPFYVSFSVSLEGIRMSRHEVAEFVFIQEIVIIVGIGVSRGEGAVFIFPGSIVVVEVVVIGVGMRRGVGAEFIYIHIHIIIVIVVVDRNVVGVVSGSGSGGAGGLRCRSRGSGGNGDIEESQGGVNFGLAVEERAVDGPAVHVGAHVLYFKSCGVLTFHNCIGETGPEFLDRNGLLVGALEVPYELAVSGCIGSEVCDAAG